MSRDLEREYVEQVGHEPPVDDSDDAWQWEYRGTKGERETLVERLDLPSEDDGGPLQEEQLFGGART